MCNVTLFNYTKQQIHIVYSDRYDKTLKMNAQDLKAYLEISFLKKKKKRHQIFNILRQYTK